MLLYRIFTLAIFKHYICYFTWTNTCKISPWKRFSGLFTKIIIKVWLELIVHLALVKTCDIWDFYVDYHVILDYIVASSHIIFTIVITTFAIIINTATIVINALIIIAIAYSIMITSIIFICRHLYSWVEWTHKNYGIIIKCIVIYFNIYHYYSFQLSINFIPVSGFLYLYYYFQLYAYKYTKYNNIFLYINYHCQLYMFMTLSQFYRIYNYKCTNISYFHLYLRYI